VAAPTPRIRALGPQRVRARAGILAAIAIVVALTAGIFVATIGYLETATTSGARQLVRAAPVDAASVVIETHLADDVQAQSAAAAALLDDQFAGTPVTVDRTLRAGALSSDRDRSILAIADPELLRFAQLVDGDWPDLDSDTASTGAIPAALQADAAESLGVAVGDDFRVGSSAQGITVRVVATWRATDAAAPRFAGDPAVASGASGTAAGPLVVSEADLVALPSGHYVRWTVTPRIGELDAASIAALETSADVEGISAAIRRDGGITDESTTVAGALADTAARVRSVASAASALSSIPLALTGVIALITLLQLSSLLAGSRQGETYMFRARGASVPQLARWAGVETLGIALPAVLVGAVAGVLVTGGSLAAPSVGQIVCAAAVEVVAIVAIWIRGVAAARTGGSSATRQVAGILPGLLTVFALLAAALSTWQLLLYGSVSLSPLASFAPTLGVAALVLLFGAALAPIASVLARVLARARSLVPALAARQVARQASIFAVASLVVALATGGVTVATVISAQIAAVDSETTALGIGSDVRVRLDVQGQVTDGTAPLTALPYADLPGATASAVVLAGPATIGTDDVDLVGIAAASLPRVVTPVTGRVDPAALAARFDHPAAVALPGAASELVVTVDTSAGPDVDGGVNVQAWLADATGALAKVDLGTVAFDGSGGDIASGSIPAGVAPWSLLAIDATLTGAPSSFDIAVDFIAVKADDTALAPGLARASVSSERTSDRSMVGSLNGAGLGAEPLGVIVSDDLAARADLATGSEFDLTLSTGRAIPAVVVATAPVVPGSTAGLGALVDLVSLDAAMLADGGPVLQAADIWIASADPAATSEGATLASNYPASVEDRQSASVAPLLDPTTSALVADLGGVVLIALIAFAATAATLARSRREEGIVLSALGAPARAQALLRGVELAAVTLFAALTGVVAGSIAATLTAGTLAVSAVPGSPAGSGVPPLLPAVLPLVGVLACLVLIVVVYASAVGRGLALRRARRPAVEGGVS